MNHISRTNKLQITHARFTDNFEYLCVVEANIICGETFQKVKFFRVKAGPTFELMDNYTNPNSEEIVSVVSYTNSKKQKVFATVGKNGRVLEWETFKENLNSSLVKLNYNNRSGLSERSSILTQSISVWLKFLSLDPIRKAHLCCSLVLILSLGICGLPTTKKMKMDCSSKHNWLKIHSE
jgi:hypothetical protein